MVVCVVRDAGALLALIACYVGVRVVDRSVAHVEEGLLRWSLPIHDDLSRGRLLGNGAVYRVFLLDPELLLLNLAVPPVVPQLTRLLHRVDWRLLHVNQGRCHSWWLLLLH